MNRVYKLLFTSIMVVVTFLTFNPKVLAITLPTKDSVTVWLQNAVDNKACYKRDDGCQCTDLVLNYLYANWKTSTKNISGHANTYLSNLSTKMNVKLTQVESYYPQVGDIFVDVNGKYGHTGVIFSVSGNKVVYVHQNAIGNPNKGSPAEKRTINNWNVHVQGGNIGLLRPEFKEPYPAPSNAVSANEVPTGVYEIEWTGNSNLVWDVYGASKENSGPLTLYKKDNGLNQRFYLIRDDAGRYQIEPLNSHKVVEIKGNIPNYGDGAKIQQYDKNGSDDYLWYITKEANGRYSFINVYSYKAVDVKNEDKVTLQAFSYKPNIHNQNFKLNKISQFESDAVAKEMGFTNITLSSYNSYIGKTISIKTTNSNKFLSARNPKTPIVSDNNNSNYEKFEVGITSDKVWLRFKNVETGKYISARDDEKNTPVRISVDSPSMWEDFKFYTKDGRMYIVSQVNTKAWMAYHDANFKATGALSSYSINVAGWEEFSIVVNEKKCTIAGKTNLNANDPNCKNEVAKKTQYRYRDKITKNATTVESGWNIQSETLLNYGAWSNWTTNACTNSDSVQCENRSIHIGYNTRAWWAPGAASGQYDFFSTDCTVWNAPGCIKSNNTGTIYYTKADWDSLPLVKDNSCNPAKRCVWSQVSDLFVARQTGRSINGSPTNTIMFSYENVYEKQYRYRIGNKVYVLWKWNSWSNWQDTPVNGSTNREVETRTVNQ